MGWLRQLFTRRRRYDELSESIREHLYEKIADLMDHGMTREQAQRVARRQFGNVTVIEERSREVWQWPMLESLWADTKYALRRLRKSPGFTSIALLTLALGIGANTGLFTLLDTVLLKSLPVPNPEQLFIVKQGGHPAEKSRFSYPFFDRVRLKLPDAASIAAMSWPDDFYVRIGGEQPQPVQGQLVSGDYFQVFEAYPVLGRLITPADDEKLGSSVAVISYGYWQRQFGADPAVVGRKLEVNSVQVTVVGVAPQGFFGARAGTQPAFWIPLTMQSVVGYHDHYSDFGAQPLKPWIPQGNINWLLLVVRVKSAAAVPQLMTALNQQYRNSLESLAQYLHDPDELQAMLRSRLSLEPGQRGFANLREQFEQPLLLLMSMAAIVLLIACANIANLLLARAAARQHALALQLSIGAGRARLIQQMLAECLLLSTGGAVLGIGVAYACATALPRWTSTGNATIPLNLAPDARVLAFSVIIAVATGVLSGLAPALQSASVDPATVLKGGPQSIPGSERVTRSSIRKMLVVAQVALSLLLLVGAGMFLQTLENYSRLDPGFDRNHLLNVQIDTHLVNYQISDFPSLYERLADRMEAIPGVRSASITSCSLVAGCFDSSDVVVTDGSGRKIARANAQVNSVSTNYFATTGIQLLRGREFATTDDASAPKVAIVNQTFARRYVDNRYPIGLEFSYVDNQSNRYQIIGVVSDARVNDIREAAPPIIYFPIAQNVGNIDGLEVRTAADPHWVAVQARQAIADVDPRIPVVNVATLNEEVKDNLTQPRLIARLTTIFGILALALACLGLYGVMSYTMQRRTSELGVRLALGSTRTAVLWLVIRETLLLAGFGAVMGLVLAVAGMRMATSFLFGLSPEDPSIIVLATGLLLLASALAGFVPAWRAAHIEPGQALRFE